MKERRREVEADYIRAEIKVWMARRRMSAGELAEAMGRAPSWVSKRIGSGATVMLTVDDLFEFAHALDVPVTEFFRAPEDSGSTRYTNYRSA